MTNYTIFYSGADSKWHVSVAGKDVFSHADPAEIGFFEARLRTLPEEREPKIIQILIGPDNATYQGHLFGLGSDGACYVLMPEGWTQFAAPL